ncbi:argininosuccinate lyase [Gordonibacter massiliensis (ex Traore et al. 2017)]|uniref:Argininosuccinate lyase n=1 Tax=Gordonibacter massiliensis (ex Traore et al. 2017) TaxID=1841863 RepID=A0A842JLB5_9ACTN|nr:argininosuccinate lyase [Gordonibacter massiliensis (ex Traore et al. 2017)]MBC2889979.1 argininosuccinate lyase [Gordonibacter massiliensis (ex Traore et al. 2017)]
MALWSGRFTENVSEFTQRFGASLPVDKALFAQDIAGSKAHAAMLAKAGVIADEDAAAIAGGLERVQDSIEAGEFSFDINDEDIHMSVESALIADIGDAGARLHTGRSRNDQVATDTRLFAKQRCEDLMHANVALRHALVAQAEAHPDVIMPGYTHLQHAQPVLFAHHMLAYVWMLTRDYGRLISARRAADASPLGAAALAGTTYPLDRQMTAEQLGFSQVIPNSLDAVSDRDFLLDLSYACSVSCMHLSRLCEEIVLWSTAEFDFIELSDAFSTGSSIMPQKKNPDFAELIRGKTGRVVGDLVALLVTMKALPLAYNKDLQEDKEGAIDAAKTLEDCLVCAAGMIETMSVKSESMRAQAKKGYLAATDVADYLAKKGMPFRRAHEVVGHLVLLCEQRGCDLEDLTLDDFRAESELFESDIVNCLDLESIVAARTTEGGTGHVAVAEQLAQAKAALEADEASL